MAAQPTDVTETPRNVILCGDVLTELRKLPDGCVQTCVTSPPYYGLRAYGTDPVVWGGVSTCKHQWGDVIRTPWANEVPGPNGRKKNLTASHWKSKETGPFCQLCAAWCGELGQEPSPARYVAHLVQVFHEVGRVLAKNGTLFLNLGDSYAGSMKGMGADGTAYGGPMQRTNRGSIGLPVQRKIAEGFKSKDLMLIPHRVAIALQDDGWYVRQDIVWNKPNAMPESVTDRPSRSHEYVFLLTKSERYFYNADAIREPHKDASLERVKLPLHTDRQRGYPGSPQTLQMGEYQQMCHPNGRNARSVWDIPTESFSGAHYAVMPIALAERCVLAGTRPGDIALDPFFGRGTVGLAAKANGRNYIGIEAKPENVTMAEVFIGRGGQYATETKPEAGVPTLFDGKVA